MNPTRRDLTRLLALGAAAAVIAVPVGLIAVTWVPLEPAPDGGRNDGEEVTPETDRKRRRQGPDKAPVTPEASGRPRATRKDHKESSAGRATPET